jgi:hypothetical protein
LPVQLLGDRNRIDDTLAMVEDQEKPLVVKERQNAVLGSSEYAESRTA